MAGRPVSFYSDIDVTAGDFPVRGIAVTGGDGAIFSVISKFTGFS